MNKDVKTYDENGIKYQFDAEKLRYYMELYRKQLASPGEKPVSRTKVRKNLAAAVSVSPDTVKSWATGTNGPVDLQLVERIGEYFGIDYHILLTEKEEENTNMRENKAFFESLDKKQQAITRERVKEIYEAIIEASEKVWRYFLTELYTETNSPEMAKRYYTEYEEAEDSCDKVAFLLGKYKLDIPEEKYQQICRFKNEKADFVLMNASCAFTLSDEDDDDQTKSDLWLQYMNRFNPAYEEKVQKIFGEYQLK